MDNSMLRYWPPANNGKLYTVFGGMCVWAANIPLQEGEQQGRQHFYRSGQILQCKTDI
jgi:hypothetical protein